MVAGTRGARRARAGVVVGVAALIVAGCGSSTSSSTRQGSGSQSAPAQASSTPSSQLGPERIPLERGPVLAPASTTSPGTTVDGIQCAPVERLTYHIHAHLQVYVGGGPRSLPGAIGLVAPLAEATPVGPFYAARQCYYWLHTHASDGVIHIESPKPSIYTLGDFFDEWRQPLGPDQVAGARGKVTALVDGQRWTQSPRRIPLLPHAVIQLDVGTPVVPFASVSWAGTVL